MQKLILCPLPVFLMAFSLVAQVEAQQESEMDSRIVDKEEVVKGFDLLEKDLGEMGGAQMEMLRMSAKSSGLDVPILAPRNASTEIGSTNGELNHTLEVDYHTHQIFNPELNHSVKVRLRSYNKRLMGETLVIKPGDTMNVDLINRLPEPPAEPVCEVTPLPFPHDPIDHTNFNTTNLHTHGLHVSPSGNSDNVLIAVPPGESFQNEIKLPKHHAPGTFWYHAHVHGSTAIQATSGMAGPLIVEGGLDDIEKLKDAPDYIMMFQQIPYVASPDQEDLYEIECYDKFGPRQWQEGITNGTGWRTTINGLTQPYMVINPGRVVRWRAIHAAFRETISLSVVPFGRFQATLQAQTEAIQNGDEGDAITEPKSVATRRAAVLSEAIDLHEVAADGLAYGFDWVKKEVSLQPGYRSDMLLRIDEPGLYVIVDNEVAEAQSLQGRYETPKVLGYILVLGPRYEDEFPTNAELEPLRVHETIEDDELAAMPQMVTFNLFTVDEKPFSKNVIRQMRLGTVYEWELRSKLVNHPFHIHVNPFEITEWKELDPETNEWVDKLPKVDGEPRTIWKDTILVVGRTPQEPEDLVKQILTVRSRNERYIGKFVLHCHILDHEDQGMMQIVEITPPGEAHGHGHGNGHGGGDGDGQ